MKKTLLIVVFPFSLICTFTLYSFRFSTPAPEKMKQDAVKSIDPPIVYYQPTGILSMSWNPTGDFPSPYSVEVYAEPKYSSFYAGPQVTYDAYMTRYYTLPLDKYITVFITAGPYHVTTSTTFYNASPGLVKIPAFFTKK